MNECFLIGEIIYIGEFRFLIGNNLCHKSAIEIVLKSIDKEEIKCVGFDEIADLIHKKDFKFVCIQGRLKTKGYVKITEIIEI